MVHGERTLCSYLDVHCRCSKHADNVGYETATNRPGGSNGLSNRLVVPERTVSSRAASKQASLVYATIGDRRSRGQGAFHRRSTIRDCMFGAAVYSFQAAAAAVGTPRRRHRAAAVPAAQDSRPIYMYEQHLGVDRQQANSSPTDDEKEKEEESTRALIAESSILRTESVFCAAEES